jgi:FkbM family methyltransferase
LIFVDVGSHRGQTIDEVRRYEYGFDIIHAVEPMPDQARFLRERYRFDPRVIVHQFALSHSAGLTTMFGDNEHLEASLFPSKVDVDENIRTSVRAVRASDFFDELDGCIVNMNCEGGEVPILEDLLQTGGIKRIAHLMVDFDARYVVGMEEAPRNIVKRLDASGIDYRGTFPDLPTHAEQIASWLRGVL